MDQLEKDVLGNFDSRTACRENELRRRLSIIFREKIKNQGLGIRDFAKKTGTSISQVQRIIHNEVGGSLTLRTIVRACDILGLRINIEIK